MKVKSKIHIKHGTLDAIVRLRKDNPEYEQDEKLLTAHARITNADKTSWASQYAELNQLNVKDLALVLAGHYEIIDPVEDALRANPILYRVQNIVRKQTAKGIEKYGTSVQANNLTTEQWLDHASEEAADLLVYLQAMKEKLMLEQDDALLISRAELEKELQAYCLHSKQVYSNNDISGVALEGRYDAILKIARVFNINVDGWVKYE